MPIPVASGATNCAWAQDAPRDLVECAALALGATAPYGLVRNLLDGADQLTGLERLREHRCVEKLRRQMDTTIPRNKEERFTALSKGKRDRLHAFAVQIGIKHPDIARTVVEGVQCLIKRAHARRYLEASPAQHSFHINCDKRLILDNENPFGHCALPLEAV